MENEETIHKILDLVQACGYSLDEQKREAISQVVDTWLSQNSIHFVRDRENGITTLTVEESTKHSPRMGALLSAFDIEKYLTQTKDLSFNRGNSEPAKKNEPKTIRSIKTHRFSLSSDGFSYTKEKKQDPPEPSLNDEFQRALNNSDSTLDFYDSIGGNSQSIEGFSNEETCRNRVSQLHTDILKIVSTQDENIGKFGMSSFSKSLMLTANWFNKNKDNAIDPETMLRDGLVQMEQSRRKSALLKFMTALDQAIFQIMRATKTDHTQALDWLYAEGDSTKQKYRLQAVQSYPLLMPLMIRSASTGNFYDRFIDDIFIHPLHDNVNRAEENNEAKSDVEKGTSEELQSVIDEGKPLAQYLQTHDVGPFKTLSKRVLKSVGRIKEVPEELARKTNYYRYLAYLEHVDSNLHPKTPEELVDFVDCAKRIEKLHKITGQPVEDIIKTTQGKWSWWKERTVSDEAIGDINDYFEAIYNTVLAPRVYQRVDDLGIQAPKSEMQQRWMQAVIRAGKNDLIRDFAASYSALDILDCSQKWHEFGDTYRTRMAALKTESGIDQDSIQKVWLPLSEPYTASNGIIVKPMTTQEDLEATGEYNDEGLHFCVGTHGYWAKCMTENDHIVVLFDENGKRLTAAELREVVDENGNVSGLHTAQHQAKARANPSDAQHAALSEYISALFNQDEWKPDFEVIEAARVDNRKEFWRSGLPDVLGFDPSKQEARKKAVSIMQEFLPKALRTLDHDGVIVANDMDDKVDKRIHDIHARAKEGKITAFGGPMFFDEMHLNAANHLHEEVLNALIRRNANDNEQMAGRMARRMILPPLGMAAMARNPMPAQNNIPEHLRQRFIMGGDVYGHGGHGHREDIEGIINLPDNNPE